MGSPSRRLIRVGDRRPERAEKILSIRLILSKFPHRKPMGSMWEQAVSRVLFPEPVTRLRDNGHSSSPAVAGGIQRPTRELGRTALRRSPIWTCSRRGLPSSCRRRQDW